MKKALLLLMSVILTLTLSFGVVLPALADDSVYGTPETGMIGPNWHFVNVTPTQELQNGDFEQGLKYWATTPIDGKDPTQVVEIKEENGNKYMSFKAQAEWDGIHSPRFTAQGVKVAQQLVLIYDWRGVSDFQIYLAQWLMTPEGEGYYKKDANGNNEIGAENRLSAGSGEVLKEATTDEEWNTSMTQIGIPVIEPPADADPNIYLTAAAQVCTDPTVEADIDNIRVAIYRDNEKKLYALDGTTVLFDLNVQQEEEDIEEDYEEEDTDSDSDDDADVDTDTDDTDSDAENADDDDADTDADGEDESTSSGLILWICVGAGVILIAAAVVVVLMILKNKKAQATEETVEVDNE